MKLKEFLKQFEGLDSESLILFKEPKGYKNRKKDTIAALNDKLKTYIFLHFPHILHLCCKSWQNWLYLVFVQIFTLLV